VIPSLIPVPLAAQEEDLAKIRANRIKEMKQKAEQKQVRSARGCDIT